MHYQKASAYRRKWLQFGQWAIWVSLADLAPDCKKAFGRPRNMRRWLWRNRCD